MYTFNSTNLVQINPAILGFICAIILISYLCIKSSDVRYQLESISFQI